VSLAINKFFDEDETKLEIFIEYFRKLLDKKLINTIDISKGIALLFNQLPNIESDIPHLPSTFSKFLKNICFGSNKLIDFSNLCLQTLEWKEDISFEIYAKIIAVLTDLI